MPILELKQIRKRLGGQSVLKGVDLSLEEGEVVVILGPVPAKPPCCAP